MGRAQRDGKDFRYVRPTPEEEAAFMATAHAKFTGEVGVCISTSGPGAIHLMNGLYDANLERMFSDAAVFVRTVSTPMHVQLMGLISDD